MAGEIVHCEGDSVSSEADLRLDAASGNKCMASMGSGLDDPALAETEHGMLRGACTSRFASKFAFDRLWLERRSSRCAPWRRCCMC